MNKKIEIPKFSRKNKKSHRELKQLNSDYFIKVLEPDKKTSTTSRNMADTNKGSVSNKKMFSSESSCENFTKKTRCDSNSKTIKKRQSEMQILSRTRSNTVLNIKKSDNMASSFL
jgi:hypothetical protein